jgi:hypothetical protein
MAEFATFDELIADVDGTVAQIARELRQLTLDVHPAAVEVVRLGDRAATYGLGPKKMIEGYAYIMPQAKHVNLGFYQGAALPDPLGLLEGSGKAMRHIKVKSLAAAGQLAMRALLAAAVAERKQALGRRG